MALKFLMAALIVLAILTPVRPAAADPSITLTIAAANSLKDFLRKTVPQFEAQHPDITVRIVYGPSQKLREQVEQGAPIDVLLPSSLDDIEQLEAKGLTIPRSKVVFAETALVIITSATHPTRVSDAGELGRSEVRRIAIGDRRTSGVGKFTEQFLQSVGLHKELKDRYVYGEHSAAVLHLVASGEAELGIVYRADTIGKRNVRIVAEAPQNSHRPVLYAAATVWTSRQPEAAEHLKAFLLSTPVQESLGQYGFEQARREVRTAKSLVGPR